MKRQITRVTVLAHNPQRCCLCFSEHENWFIDTGLDTTFDGTFYICVRCLNIMVGLSPEHFTQNQVTHLLHENRMLKDEAMDQLAHAEEKMKKMELRLEKIRGYTYE